jgi:hypothetical protein
MSHAESKGPRSIIFLYIHELDVANYTNAGLQLNLTLWVLEPTQYFSRQRKNSMFSNDVKYY